MSVPLPQGDEKMIDHLVAEHEDNQHLYPVRECPRCANEMFEEQAEEVSHD